MIRAFIALPLPEELRTRLAILSQMLPLPRRLPPENFHVTLAFLGNTPEPVLEEVHFALEALRVPAFDLALSGVGAFGGARPRLVYAGVAPNPSLIALQQKVETAARRFGVDIPSRRFVPHVTLARFPPEAADLPRLEKSLVQFSTFAAGPMRVGEFSLMESHLTPHGAIYDELASYPLR